MGLPSIGDNAELYDPASGTFFSLAGGYAGSSHPSASFFGEDALTLLPDGRALMVSVDSPIALYNPASGTFSLTTTTWSYVDFSATLLMNGKVLLAGGENDDNDFSFRNAWLYDSSTGNFTATGSMTEARYYHAATAKSNGCGAARRLEARKPRRELKTLVSAVDRVDGSVCVAISGKHQPYY